MSHATTLLTHTAVAVVAAISAGLSTYLVVTGHTDVITIANAQAQNVGQRNTDLMTQFLPDIGRQVQLTLTERDPGSSSPLHQHRGHSFGFVVEGISEVKIGDEPIRQLKAGDSYYEAPEVLHMVRNPSADKQLKYLQIQVVEPNEEGSGWGPSGPTGTPSDK